MVVRQTDKIKKQTVQCWTPYAELKLKQDMR